MNYVEQLVGISREVGRDPEWVLAGGGNTSVKDEGFLYIKASGTGLADLTAEGLVRMDMSRLDEIWRTTYPTDTTEREARALADLMASRAPGEESKRPSVETLMHALLPFRFVVHTHPSMINGVTCSREGESAARRLFGDRALWIPTVNPGYVLARTLKERVDSYTAEQGSAPEIILLQNHGLVVAADSVEEVRGIQDEVAARVRHHVGRHPDLTPVAADRDRVTAAVAAVKSATGAAEAVFFTNAEIERTVADRRSLDRVISAYSPDHIVYAGVEPLFVPESVQGAVPDAHAVEVALTEYRDRLSADPKVVALQRLGVVGLGPNRKAAERAHQLFLDALKVSVFADSFGGYQFLPPDQVAFIRNWEVEQYRSNLSEKGGK
ncbi:class II aldolase/adducin family protein [Salinispira pacifica]